ncbi:MAG: hypothetical protein AAB560_02630 [Patescibacteria group bacterium]
MDTNNNQAQTSALARAKRLAAAAKKVNDDFERRTDELAKQAKRNADELEKLEANLQQTEIDAINKMDAELIRFLSSDEEDQK